MAAHASNTATVTVRHQGRRYWIERRAGLQPGTVREFWPGRGVLGSQRAWLGDRHAARPSWYAAVNPTGEAFKATTRVEGLPSRRAATRCCWPPASPSACPGSSRSCARMPTRVGWRIGCRPDSRATDRALVAGGEAGDA